MKNPNAHQKLLTLLQQLAFANEKLDAKQLLSVLENIKQICVNETTMEIIMSSLKSLSNHDVFKTKKLTDRETQIVLLISEGLRSVGIAEKLNLSKSTIETHRKNIRKKLNLKGNDSLFAFALVFSLQSKSH